MHDKLKEYGRGQCGWHGSEQEVEGGGGWGGGGWGGQWSRSLGRCVPFFEFCFCSEMGSY